MQQGEENVFLREVELKSLQKQYKEVEKKQESIKLEISELNEKKKQLQQHRLELDKAVRKSEMKLVEENFMLQTVIVDLQKVEKEQSDLDKELKALKTIVDNLTFPIDKLEQEYIDAQEQVRIQQTQYQEINKQVEEKKSYSYQ